jgi:aryl-alcohol dehydrogenase-like predicted oxidoreductase
MEARSRTAPETRRLGDTGLEVTAIGLGCNNFGVRLDHDGARLVVDAALDSGVTFFDTADAYGDGASEELLGSLLHGRRDQVVLATKFGWGAGPGDGVAHGAPAAVKAALERSLERLRTDHVDLYYYHRPDGLTPFEETLGALSEAVEAGTVRHIGCSNLTAAQLAEANDGTHAFGAAQDEYNVLRGAGEVLDLCRQLNMAFVAYRPLAQGLLTGKYKTGVPAGSRLEKRREALVPEDLSAARRLEDYARERGRTLLELALGSVLAQPGVTSAIAGAMTPEQLRANVAAGDWVPTQDELAEIAAIVSV